MFSCPFSIFLNAQSRFPMYFKKLKIQPKIVKMWSKMGTVFDLLLRIFGWIFNFLKYIGKRLWTTLGVQKYAKWAWKHLEFWIFGIFGILGHFFSCGKGNLGILPTLPNQPQNAKWARKRLISGLSNFVLVLGVLEWIHLPIVGIWRNLVCNSGSLMVWNTSNIKALGWF